MGLFKSFDTYNLKARVFPALIAGLPSLAFLFLLVPWDHIGLSQLTAAAMGLVLLFAFADLARSTGKRVQAKLATGETPEQWHRGNRDVAEAAKDRYRAFVAGMLKTTAPSEAEERDDPRRADDFYRSAGTWLREHTRDVKTYALLFGENITYGYRRNLLGLKPISIGLNLVILLLCGAIWLFKPRYFEELKYLDEKLIIIFVAAIVHTVYMIFAVSAANVREASRAYGRQLILSCETLMAKAKPPITARKAKSDAAR